MAVVLSVVGGPRSGSTVIGRLLGELEGFHCAGEVRLLWSGLTKTAVRRCGCGVLLRSCPLWLAVTEELASKHSEFADPEENLRVQQVVLGRHHQWRRTPGLLGLGINGAQRHPDVLRFSRLLGATFEALAAVTGSRILVDSSKKPDYAAILRLAPGVAVSYLHLVRDPRGTLFSHIRRRANDGSVGSAHPVKALHRSASWVLVNLGAAAVCGRHQSGRSLLVRYETFVEEPRRTIEDIAAFVDEFPAIVPIGPDGTAQLGPTHTAHGNENRLTSGEVVLSADLRWERDMHPFDRWASTIISGPLMRRYHYPLRIGRGVGQTLPPGGIGYDHLS